MITDERRAQALELFSEHIRKQRGDYAACREMVRSAGECGLLTADQVGILHCLIKEVCEQTDVDRAKYARDYPDSIMRAFESWTGKKLRTSEQLDEMLENLRLRYISQINALPVESNRGVRIVRLVDAARILSTAVRVSKY